MVDVLEFSVNREVLSFDNGSDALEYYVDKWLETDNLIWAISGGISALWTPETYQQTGWTLVSALSANNSVQNVGKWAHYPHKRGHKFPHLQFGDKRIKVYKAVIDFIISSVKIAICCTPAPSLKSKYSSIWDFFIPLAGSLIGSFTRQFFDRTTIDFRDEYCVLISVSSKRTKVVNPKILS